MLRTHPEPQPPRAHRRSSCFPIVPTSISGGDALVEISSRLGGDPLARREDRCRRPQRDERVRGSRRRPLLRPRHRPAGTVNNVVTATCPDGAVRASPSPTTDRRAGVLRHAGRPWVCTTKVTNPTPNNPTSATRSTPSATSPRRSTATSTARSSHQFATYDPASPPAPNAIANTTTDEGNTVPYIVRIERGVINRGKYDIAYLANPANPTAGWQPWRSPNWNGKLFWKFGSGCEYGRTQANPGGVRRPTMRCAAASWSPRRR